jgi:hypothetical protein
MDDDRAQLSAIAEKLDGLCAHVSVREDDEVPYLFAVGLRHVHSLDLRRREGILLLEFWRGPPNADQFIREEPISSFDAALARCEEWLRNDIG